MGTLEALLKRDRYVVLAALLALTVLAWSYLLWLTANMTMPRMGPAMTRAGVPLAMDILLTFSMWAVMMVGMMTPSVAPMILVYARMGRQSALHGRPFAATGWFAGGYFLAWTVFSALAASAQIALRSAALLTPMLDSATPVLGGVILVAAGVYQWSRLKTACLVQCREPLQFIQRLGGFRGNAAGSLTAGFRHGLYCIGCCWALMLLLFVGGVMNTLWVAGLAVLVLMEKFPAQGNFLTRATGAVLMGGGFLLIFRWATG